MIAFKIVFTKTMTAGVYFVFDILRNRKLSWTHTIMKNVTKNPFVTRNV